MDNYLIFVCFLLTFAFTLEVKASASEEELQPCLDLITDEIAEECCESLKIFKSMDDTLELCTKKDLKDLNCDDYNCVFSKLGMIKGGKIDEDGAKKFFTGLAADHPEQARLIDYIGVACFDGKYNNYDFDEENCPAINFYVCGYTNILLECDSWKKSDDCKIVSENAKSCKAVLEGSK